MFCSCGLPVVFTPETVVGSCVYGVAYLLFVNCMSCGSTRAAILHEGEDDECEELAAE